MASEKVTAMIEEIKALTVLELSELVHALEEEFGVSAAAMAAPAAGAAAPAAEEKTEFDVVLTGFDAAAKIKVIKVVREITGLGLAEAKAAVEGTPKTLKEALSKEDAEAMKAKVEEARRQGGAEVSSLLSYTCEKLPGTDWFRAAFVSCRFTAQPPSPPSGASGPYAHRRPWPPGCRTRHSGSGCSTPAPGPGPGPPGTGGCPHAAPGRRCPRTGRPGTGVRWSVMAPPCSSRMQKA